MRTLTRSPWIVAGALALAGASGAVAVYVAGSRISAADRATIVAWERAAVDATADARTWLGRLPSIAGRLSDPRAATDLQAARVAFAQGIRALEELDTPSIMRRTAEHLSEFLASGSDAIDLLLQVEGAPPGAGFDVAIHVARTRYERARNTMVRLRCRARLSECEDSLLAS